MHEPRRHLTLETSWSKTAIHDPSEAQLHDAIARLYDEDDFLILSASDGDYAQARPGAVEYRQTDQHFHYDFGLGDKRPIELVMNAYYRNSPLAPLLPWQDITQELTRSGNRAKWIIAAFAVAAAGYVVWSYLRS